MFKLTDADLEAKVCTLGNLSEYSHLLKLILSNEFCHLFKKIFKTDTYPFVQECYQGCKDKDTIECPEAW